jgi:hypothetical protein
MQDILATKAIQRPAGLKALWLFLFLSLKGGDI